MNRRRFMQTAAGLAAFFAARKHGFGAFAETQPLRKFVSPLRTLAQMSVATPVATYHVPGCDPFEHFLIELRQSSYQFHPDLPPSRIWGYGDPRKPFTYLGGSIPAREGVATRVTFVNNLPSSHILPVDNTVPGVTPEVAALENRAIPHLHGGFVHWTSDGTPHQWFTPNPAISGAYRKAWLPDVDTGVPTTDHWYPNLQSARLMWYHDHALGNTRLNAYAGLAAGYILRDSAEDDLVSSGAIPADEIPLIIQDKVFTSPMTADDYSQTGDLWYPRTYHTEFFDLESGALPLPQPSLVPEFWGDTMVVNGTAYPYMDVEPRRYRLRMLNACNTRFLSLRLVRAQGADFPASTEPDLQPDTPISMTLIGNECGFLDPAQNPQGVPIGDRKRPLVLAPAERADVIIDFSSFAPGTILLLHNDAPVPFPGGTPLADFHPRNPKLAAPPQPGFSPNTRTVVQFRVGSPVQGPNPAPAGWQLPPLSMPLLAPLGVLSPPPGVPVRHLTLNEAIDEYGRLMQLIGSPLGELFGMEFGDPPTERPGIGAVEVWRIFNLSADAHPMHFHLVNAQILSRQPINAKRFEDAVQFTGAARGPDPDERGWKETIRMYPDEVTTVIMKFDIPRNPVIPIGRVPTPVPIPTGPRGGHEYVWHCHILEHEEHDMMRPLIVG